MSIKKREITIVQNTSIIKSSDYNENDPVCGKAGYIAEIINGKVKSILDIMEWELSLRDCLPKNKGDLIILRDFLSEVIENIKEED